MQIKRRNQNAIIILLLEFIPILLLMLLNIPNNTVDAMKNIGIIALICFIISIVAIRRISNEINGFVYFITFAYLFSFGQSYMALIGNELHDAVFAVSNGFFSSTSLVSSAVFTLFAIQFTCIGFCLIYKQKEIQLKTCKHVEMRAISVKEDKARRVGWILLTVSIVPTFYNLFREYRTMLTMGYAATLSGNSGSQILTIIAGFFTSGLLLLFCFEKNKRRRYILYFIILSYWLLQMAGGSRIYVFRSAIVFLMITDLYFHRMNRRRWILLLLIAVGGAFVMTFVARVRSYLFITDDVRKLFSNTFSQLLENNFVFAAINEMGNTQIINTLVMDKCPSIIPFQFGMSFVKMLWGIIPNFVGSTYKAYIGVDITFSPFYTLSSAGMGASYISEGYWNFGYFALIYFIGFGALWGKMVSIFKRMCDQHDVDPGRFFLVVYVIFYALFLVRSESLGFGRSFVYYGIFPYLLINTKSNKR